MLKVLVQVYDDNEQLASTSAGIDPEPWYSKNSPRGAFQALYDVGQGALGQAMDDAMRKRGYPLTVEPQPEQPDVHSGDAAEVAPAADAPTPETDV